MRFELFVLGVVGLVGEDELLLIFLNFLWFRFLLMYYKYPHVLFGYASSEVTKSLSCRE